MLLRVLVEDRGEGCGGVGGEGAALVQVDAGEEGLVREALVLLVAALVDLCEVAGEIESSVDEGTGSLVVVVVLGDLRFDPVKFGAEPGLELLQLVQGQGVGEVGFEELVLLGEDLLTPFGEVADGLVRACGELVELVGEHPPGARRSSLG